VDPLATQSAGEDEIVVDSVWVAASLKADGYEVIVDGGESLSSSCDTGQESCAADGSLSSLLGSSSETCLAGGSRTSSGTTSTDNGLERVLLRRGGNLTGLLALLAPLAALPLIAGTALPLSMAPLLAPAMSTVLGRRRRRDLLATFIGNNVRYRTTRRRKQLPISHISQEEQQQDEVLAGYLQCSGMLAADNHCLERLACQFSADALRGPLHKDVASL
ncbi:hypothetical protein MTO96_011400, partial [Rhipicephalus appendiculatus]